VRLGRRQRKGDIKMNMERIKWILLAVFLILEGLMLLGLSLGGNLISIVAGLCALIAGILFLIYR
jgi:hypothetical protein